MVMVNKIIDREKDVSYMKANYQSHHIKRLKINETIIKHKCLMIKIQQYTLALYDSEIFDNFLLPTNSGN